MGGWNWRYTAKLSDRICKSEKGKKLKTENWKKKYKEPFRPFSPLFCQTKFLVRVGQMIFIILYFIFGITNSLYILKDVEGSISSPSSPLEKTLQYLLCTVETQQAVLSKMSLPLHTEKRVIIPTIRLSNEEIDRKLTNQTFFNKRMHCEKPQVSISPVWSCFMMKQVVTHTYTHTHGYITYATVSITWDRRKAHISLASLQWFNMSSVYIF